MSDSSSKNGSKRRGSVLGLPPIPRRPLYRSLGASVMGVSLLSGCLEPDQELDQGLMEAGVTTGETQAGAPASGGDVVAGDSSGWQQAGRPPMPPPMPNPVDMSMDISVDLSVDQSVDAEPPMPPMPPPMPPPRPDMELDELPPMPPPRPDMELDELPPMPPPRPDMELDELPRCLRRCRPRCPHRDQIWSSMSSLQCRHRCHLLMSQRSRAWWTT